MTERSYFAFKDGSKDEPFSISPKDAPRLNELRYGIFWTVNIFEGARRLENLKRITAWFVEIDGDKATARGRIAACPVTPTSVVETKNGYHVYFGAREATSVHYREIEDGLVAYFDGDKRARDATRLLRVPGFYHWKDHASPFMVQEVSHCQVSYPEKAMLHYFKIPPAPVKRPPAIYLDVPTEGSLPDKLNKLDNVKALIQLSGKACVRHEVFTFQQVSRGRLNILANDKTTPCFIDEHGKIGQGGPSIWQWLKWYGHSDSEIARIISEEFGI